MLYTIDRVQYANAHGQYYFTEFMEVKSINSLIDKQGKLIRDFWNVLFEMINEVEKNKINFLISNQQVVKIFIFYQQGLDIYIKIEMNPFINQIHGNIWTFVELQNWFRCLNNIDGQSHSKGLGAARDTNIDNYVNGILKSLYKNEHFQDDNGLELTKRLLNDDSTKGFDLDLFQFVESTGEFLIYEFLKRENQYINNIQAHPMRYSWTNKWNDNKQKYISLWNIKQHLNGRLFLINYSNNESEKVSVIEILDLDINNGIRAEEKYCMSRNIFLGWLQDMHQYKVSVKDYLSDFKKVHYDQEYFDNFNENKKTRYGAEFSNIYI